MTDFDVEVRAPRFAQVGHTIAIGVHLVVRNETRVRRILVNLVQIVVLDERVAAIAVCGDRTFAPGEYVLVGELVIPGVFSAGVMRLETESIPTSTRHELRLDVEIPWRADHHREREIMLEWRTPRPLDVGTWWTNLAPYAISPWRFVDGERPALEREVGRCAATIRARGKRAIAHIIAALPSTTGALAAIATERAIDFSNLRIAQLTDREIEIEWWDDRADRSELDRFLRAIDATAELVDRATPSSDGTPPSGPYR